MASFIFLRSHLVCAFLNIPRIWGRRWQRERGSKLPYKNSYSIKNKSYEKLLDEFDLSHCNIFNSDPVQDLAAGASTT